MRASILIVVALSGVVLGACFAEDAVEGLPCSSDDGCGDGDFRCVRGLCRAEDDDGLGGCGDGSTERGEYCYPEERQITLYMGPAGSLNGNARLDFDGDGDLDVVLSAGDGLVRFTNDLPGSGEVSGPQPLEATVGWTEAIELRPDLPEFGARVPLQISTVAAGELGGSDLPDLVFQSSGVMASDELGVALAPVREHLWIGINDDAGDALAMSPILASAGLGSRTIAATGLVLADFDADGDDDLLVVHAANKGDPTSGALLVARSAGQFDPPREVDTGGGDLPPLVADLDGDGDLEVVIVSGPRQHAAVLDESLVTEGDSPTLYDLDEGARTAALGDLTGDDALDLVVGYTTAEEVAVLAGRGDGTFDEATIFATVEVEGLAIADLDGDDEADLIVTDGEDLFVQAGYGEQLGVPVELSEQDATFVLVDDLDADGTPDLVLANSGRVELALADP